MVRAVKLYLVIPVFFHLFSCSTEKNKSRIHITEQANDYYLHWKELVRDSTKVDLNDERIDKALVNSTHIDFLSTGEIVLPDGYNKTIYIINENGGVKKKIRREGRGPGEYLGISLISVDTADNIYAYDTSQKKLLRYRAPNYDDFDEYFTKTYVSRMNAWFGPENVFTYSPYYKGKIFKQVDMVNEEVKEEAVLPDDKNFKIWLGRMQTGGITGDKKGDIYGLYPEDLTIYKFNSSLELITKIIPESNQVFYKEFPANLDPYAQDMRHEQWWESFNHLSRIKYLEENKLIVSYYGKDVDVNSNTFINIYDLENEVILAEDVALPEGGNLIGIDGKKVYLSFGAYLDENKQEVPFKLVRYRLNI